MADSSDKERRGSSETGGFLDGIPVEEFVVKNLEREERNQLERIEDDNDDIVACDMAHAEAGEEEEEEVYNDEPDVNQESQPSVVEPQSPQAHTGNEQQTAQQPQRQEREGPEIQDEATNRGNRRRLSFTNLFRRGSGLVEATAVWNDDSIPLVVAEELPINPPASSTNNSPPPKKPKQPQPKSKRLLLPTVVAVLLVVVIVVTTLVTIFILRRTSRSQNDPLRAVQTLSPSLASWTALPTNAPSSSGTVGDYLADPSNRLSLFSRLANFSSFAGFDDHNLTVFLPSQQVYSVLLAQDLPAFAESTNIQWLGHTRNLLGQHIVQTIALGTTDFDRYPTLVNAVGQPLAFTTHPPSIANTVVSLGDSNVRLSNGVLHVLDGLLPLPWNNRSLPEALVMLNEERGGDLSMFLHLLANSTMGLAVLQETRTPCTLYVPHNNAWNKTVNDDNNTTARVPTVIDPYLVPNFNFVHEAWTVMYESSNPELVFDALAGNQIRLDLSIPNMVTINNGTARIVQADFLSRWGVIHVIDCFLL